MKYLDLLNNRFACKKFDVTKQVSEENKNIILEAARLSPSSFGLEPWKFLVIKDMPLRKKLKPLCWDQPQIVDSSFIVIILSRLAHNFRSSSEFLKQKIARKNLPEDMQTFYINLITNFLTIENTGDWAKRQCYIPLSNMLNAAQSLGISSCPIEGFEAEHVKQLLIKEANIDFTDFGFSGAMATFGYKNMVQPEKLRESTQVLFEEI